jgi:hypothetical protein
MTIFFHNSRFLRILVVLTLVLLQAAAVDHGHDNNKDHHNPSRHIDNSYHAVQRNFKLLQRELDIASDYDRFKQVGNIGWLKLMPMYLWSLVLSSPIEIVNFCQVGFGVGHSATLFLSSHPTAKLYTFDLFPHNTTTENKEMGVYMKYLPMTQGAARAFIDNTFPG